MITSALIAQCRREFGDNPKTIQVKKDGDGSSTVFNLGFFPVVEGSYGVYVNNNLKTETTDYTLDKDNGDTRFIVAPPSGQEVRVEYKYAHWRDKNWLEAINDTIDELNGRGFFRQIVRSSAAITLSASKQVYDGPSACVDIYEFLVSDNFTTSGNFKKPSTNWSYQQDGNKLVLGNKPTVKNYAKISYLRNMKTYAATSATLDILDDWKELVKKGAGEKFYRYMAGKIAKQGNATIDEGHFSFSNLRTMANDLSTDFNELALRKKPTRPAKDFQFLQSGGGVA